MHSVGGLTFSAIRSTPVVLQTEAAECGLACLAMVAGHHGHRIDLGTLRRKQSISMKGTTLAHLMQISGALKMTARPLKLELGALTNLQLPAILHWDLNHFVVLVSVSPRGAIVHDPARGRRRLGWPELSKHFTGVALELAPMPDFQRRTERQRLSLRQLVGPMAGLPGTVLQVLLLAAALEVFAILSPFFMQWVVDGAIVSEDRDLLTVLGIGFLLLALVQTGVTAARSWVLMVAGTLLNLQLASRVFHRLLRLPLEYFHRRQLGDIASRFESLNTIQRTLTTSFIEAGVDGVMAIVTLGIMLVYSWKLAAVVVTACVLYSLLRLALYPPLREASEEQLVRGAKQQTNLLETMRGIQSIKLFNRETQRNGLYQNLMVDTVNASVRTQRLSILYRGLNGALSGLENVTVIWLGAHLVLSGGFSVGMLFAFAAYKQQFSSRIIGFVDKLIEFRMLGLHLERVSDIALTEPESEDIRVESPVESAPSIQVRDLSFRYAESEPFVLRGVNLTIGAGESVAIVGPSGCGKSTLAKLILGLLKPTGGEVLIDGIPAHWRGSAALRELVGTVMQEDQLFAGSIADNICFFDPAADTSRIEECARLAAVHQEIVAMPMGYNTLIGDMGTVLSGGQKQRVLLARALYKNPKILMLDEATSHLDVTRERLVNDAVRRLKLTRIIIAHRPETIATADRVVVLGHYDAQQRPERDAAAPAAQAA
jgi:ATP-binding cassette subfamily B protein RaxB